MEGEAKMKLYNVTLSYPIKVRAEDKTHVKEIILSNEMLGGIPDLTLNIEEIEDE
tara:strand:+ start:766 stop:930 length:165 start_codon:yes stop_codon:yes gene_type:complete